MRTLAVVARRASWAMLVLVLNATSAVAQRTDVVQLRNGDRLTGEVRTLSRGQLQIKTDDAGTVAMNWLSVTSVTTAGRFDVGTRDNRRYVGRLGPTAAGRLAVIDAGNGPDVTLALPDVVSLAPIRAAFLQRIDGSLDLGASYTQSSGVGQVLLDGIATYRQPSFSAAAQASITLTRNPNAPDTARTSVELGYTRVRANGWMVHPLLLVERTVEQGLNLRTTGALSLGRQLVHSNRRVMTLGGGAALGREVPVEGPSVTNVDALIALTASLFSYEFPETNIDLGVMAFPGLSEPGRLRLNTSVKCRRELFKNFSFSINGYDTYDNRPPSSGASKNDLGFSLSIGWQF